MNTNTIEINRGEDKTISLRIRDSVNDPIDLTTLSAATATFKGETSDVSVTLGSGITVENAVLGKIQVVLTETQSALLKVGNNQDFSICLEFGADIKKKKLPRAINVIDPDC